MIGSDSHGVAEAVFLRSFTADVTLIAPRQGTGPDAGGPARSSRRRASNASTDPRRRSRSTGTASSSTRPRGITPSTASIRRSAPTRTPSSPSMVGARLSEDGCIGVDAHQRTSVPGPLCGRRRGHRPRPDQPRHGRRRRRRDHDPQRSGEGPALREPGGQLKRTRRGIPVEDDPAVLEVGDAVAERDQRPAAVRKLDLEQVAGAEILDRRRRCRRAARRDRRRAGRSGRRDNIRPLRAAAARSGRPRPAIRAALRRRCGRRRLRSARPRSCRRRGRRAGGARRRRHRLSVCRARLAALSREQLQPNLALDAMRAGHCGERDALRRSSRPT